MAAASIFNLMIMMSVTVAAVNALSIAGPIIEIGDGKLMGTLKHSVSGKLHSAFHAIPFAQPPVSKPSIPRIPSAHKWYLSYANLHTIVKGISLEPNTKKMVHIKVGDLRFRPPIKNQPWTGLRNATKSSEWCVQLWTSGLIGSEDCLYLSVYSPHTEFSNISSDLPVMVYFHGGAFIFAGGSMADGYFLLDHDMILVSVDYRQGAFGFLSLNTSEVSGNQGLRDQQLALEWVRQNIHYFGGNPDLVTIFGQSAGSWSVMHHLLAPGSRNLFSRAIAQSGSIYGGLCLAPNSAEKAARQGLFFADYVGCGHESQSLQCLQNLTIEEIGFVPFLPRGSVDGVLSENPVLPEEPALLFESGEFHRVPLLLGTTDLEGILAGDIIFGLLGFSTEMVTLLWPILGPLLVAEKFPHQITQVDVEMAYHVKDFYLQSQDGIFTPQNMKDTMKMFTDSLFLYGAHKTARTVSKYIPDVYQYIFTRNGPLDFIYTSLHDLGVSHADDLYYNFDFNGNGITDFTPLDVAVANIYTSYFYTFALTGNPNFDPDLDEWEKVKPEDFAYLEIGDNVTMVKTDEEYKKRVEFWEELLKNYQHQYMNGF